MAKVDVDIRDVFARTVDALEGDGLLLATQGNDGRPNIMTIGWGTVGTIWGRPVFVALVRPSRHSYALLDQNGDFTVNLLPPDRLEAMDFCGKESGRDQDKFAATGLTAEPAKKVKAPLVAEAVLQYECRTVQRTDVVPAAFDPAIVSRYYAKGDFHRVFFGEILAVRAEESILDQG